MIQALTLAVFIPLAFWVLDTLAKVLGSISIDDTGADLCLFGVSFNATTVLVSLVSPAFRSELEKAGSIEESVAVACLFMISSLILYLLSLSMIAPDRPGGYPVIIQLFREINWKTELTVMIGFAALAMQIAFYTQSVW